MTVRTRIAPSPTGEYHIGNMRTALYDYALAKKHGGQFIVRIEDTDRGRYVEGATERILEMLKEYRLAWDEGPEVGGPYGPYFQSERLNIYHKHAHDLVEQGNAYYCFCTPERLQKVREEQQARGEAKTRYDKHCRNLSKEEIKEKLDSNTPYVIRIKVPENEKIILHDIIHGDVEFDSNEVDDAILLKSDGFPTYHLAAMVDDHLMDITHILRGIDWLPSSPIHVLIYKYFGWNMPIVAHLPNLKEKGANAKLSKRHGAVSAVDFLKEGYLPNALLNFLMFTGWNPGTEKEIYTLEEFVQDFSLEKVQKTDLVAFDREKLLWYNGYYIRQTSTKDLYQTILTWGKKYDYPLVISGDADYDIKVLALIQERMKTLAEFNSLTHYFYNEPDVNIDMMVKQAKNIEQAKEILQKFSEVYRKKPETEWTKGTLEEISHRILEENSYKPKEAFMTLRISLTGESATPPLFDTMEVLEKEKVINRISAALQQIV